MSRLWNGIERAGRTKPLCVAFTVLVLLAGCRTVEMTGRKQLLLMPETAEVTVGAAAYQQTLSEETPSSNQHYIEVVNRVGNRIAQVADRPDYDWEFRVIASEVQNAFCLPGGKVAIYEGILPVCQHEAGLAVVMSHEIAHALARHGGERMTHQSMVNGVGTAINVFSQKQEEKKRERLLQAYGVASKYGFVLPYSRKHESEADHMGLILLAKSGYDPNEAPRFWERFSAAQGSQKPPEFLSTHPADDRRAEQLRELLPQALALYQNVPNKMGLGQPIQVAATGQVAQATPSPTDPNTASPVVKTGLTYTPPPTVAPVPKAPREEPVRRSNPLR